MRIITSNGCHLKERIMRQAGLELLVSVSIIILSALFFSSPAFCHGWAGYEQGAKSHAMGNAFTGLADDPTAVYYNPAGITHLDDPQASFGFAIATVDGTFKSNGASGMTLAEAENETTVERQSFFLPNVYITSKLNERFSIGFGAYNIYGLGFKWSDSFEGRFAPGGRNAELLTLTVSPVVACQVTEKFSISVGGRVERADLKLASNLFAASSLPEVESEFSGHDYGYGWNAAMFYKASDNINLGFNYRSSMDHSFNDLDLKLSPEIGMIGLESTKANLDIELPRFASMGIAWTKGALTITADVYWWDWSANEALDFKLHQPVAGQTSMRVSMNWEDSWSYGIGTEYIVSVLDKNISLRAGLMYEECPIPDEAVGPAGFQGDNLLYNIGFGLGIGPVTGDFFFTYVQTMDRDWNGGNMGNVANPGGEAIAGEFSDYNTFIIGANMTFVF